MRKVTILLTFAFALVLSACGDSGTEGGEGRGRASGG